MGGMSQVTEVDKGQREPQRCESAHRRYAKSVHRRPP
ncbi:hypothetical protein BN159_p25 (plasmid) [Streptomyces davaonensis JCM 4913]|uniref:Uncharacterized protein n=1 Tax=Streptomyces davaonensis (strain DSM 101723 / JCM 4913 / KCC S-0913 / 768) TaxID=1214101 RepID=K4RGM5_STRDJ|nr:hypothetical protein BN159_p25 [Streptomyces davaonensis JCM 4913]